MCGPRLVRDLHQGLDESGPVVVRRKLRERHDGAVGAQRGYRFGKWCPRVNKHPIYYRPDKRTVRA